MLAQKAVARGLTVKPWVKTSLAPGSKVVTDYLRAAGVLPDMIRISVGLEHIDDILWDIDQALAAASR